MASIECEFTSQSGLTAFEGVLEVSGLSNGYAIVPYGTTDELDGRISDAIDSRIGSINSNTQELIDHITGSINNVTATINAMDSYLDAQITNLQTNYVSTASFGSNLANNSGSIVSLVETSGTFATSEALGGRYGLHFEYDANGRPYTTGFSMGSLLQDGVLDSYFKVSADKFLVVDSSGNGQIDDYGNLKPVFSIDNTGTTPEVTFNGKVYFGNLLDPSSGATMIEGGKIKTEYIDVGSLTVGMSNSNERVFTRSYGGFDSDASANAGISSPKIVGDSYYNTTTSTTMYWNGTSWSSTAGADGEAGEPGVQGPQGPQGPQGSTGSTGPRGSMSVFKTYTSQPSSTQYNTAISEAGGGSAKTGDSVIYTISGSSGNTKAAFYVNGSWSDTQLFVNGNALVAGSLQINGTFVANKIIEGVCAKIFGNSTQVATHDGVSAYTLSAKYDSTVAPSGYPLGGAIHGTSKYGFCVAGGAASNNVSTSVYGNHQSANGAGSGRGVAGVSTTGTGVEGVVESSGIAVSARNNGSSGNLFSGFESGTARFNVTKGGAVTAVSYTPFTGAHVSFSEQDLVVGDIVKAIGAPFLLNVDDSRHTVESTITSKDKAAYGVVSSECGFFNIEDFGVTSEYSTTSIEVMNEETGSLNELLTYEKDIITINREEYAVARAWMGDRVLNKVMVNSLGEGGINVCSEGGDIEIGDYLCSSNVEGKAMKQDDDLLHNYTVAKASQDVIWDELEVDNEKVFEKDGYKWMMIACTYHCG